MENIDRLISDIKTIKDRGINLTMDGFIIILENFKKETEVPNTLLDFLLYLNDKGLINNYDFDYEKEIKKFLKK